MGLVVSLHCVQDRETLPSPAIVVRFAGATGATRVTLPPVDSPPFTPLRSARNWKV